MNHIMFAGIIAKTASDFGVDWPHFIAQVISFGIVVFALHRWAYRPILTVLEQRRQRIAEGLANAEKIKAELARAEAARQEILNQANAQATKLIEEARAAAARVQEAETQKAIAAAKDIVEKARQATEAEHARMLADCVARWGAWLWRRPAEWLGKHLPRKISSVWPVKRPVNWQRR